nr:hypothetical protein [Flexivirga meconopsidis]
MISYGSIPTASDKSWLTRFLAEEFGYSRAPVELLSGWSLRDMEVSTREIWIGTYWTTAHALQVAANLGVVRADQVLYLVQDYEPDFFPGSTESALAQSTYHAGFKCIINSTPVQRALRTHEGIDVPDHLVFRPELDLGRLRRTSDRRPQRAPRRVGFYGRPSKPRNSFALGIAALRHTAGLAESAGIDLQFVSMGEPHAPIRLAEDAELSAVGKLSWESYFDALSEIPVLLSLQQSPHPSHPPLEAVASGGFAVTNDVDQTRFGLSSRLRAVRNDPIELGEAIFEAVIDTSAYVNDGVDMGFMQGLGGEFSESIAAAAGELGLS